MKKLLLISLLTVAACEGPSYQEPQSWEESSGPVLTLLSNESKIPGIRGGYCDDTGCVDGSVFPFEKIEEWGYWPMSPSDSNDLVLQADGAISSATFQILESDGTMIDCNYIPERTSDTEYSIDLCDDLEGDYIFTASVYYNEGGDVSYYYPIGIYPEPSRD